MRKWPRPSNQQTPPDSEDRPDIAISNLPALNGRYVTTYVDYTLTNCQQIGFKTTAGAGKAGVAAKAAAEKKNNHYVNPCEAVNANFFALAEENFGYKDAAYTSLLNTLADRIKENLPGQTWVNTEPLAYYNQKLAVARVNSFNTTMRSKARAAFSYNFGVEGASHGRHMW